MLTDQNTGDHLAWRIGNGDATQDTSRMGTARVKQEKEADTRIIAREWYEIWKKGT